MFAADALRHAAMLRVDHCRAAAAVAMPLR